MVAGNLVLTVLGTGMLWVGWYGFNGGSALAAGADAAFACLATQLAAATAALVWTAQDVMETGKASVLGIATGSIAGLATVTPCAGFVGPLGAVMLGVAGGVVCRFFSLVVKERYGYDDSLDVFGVHGVGGFIGTCLLGIVAAPTFGGFNTETTMMTQTVIQCTAGIPSNP
jgi:ammonia channel protein AmtB